MPHDRCADLLKLAHQGPNHAPAAIAATVLSQMHEGLRLRETFVIQGSITAVAEKLARSSRCLSAWPLRWARCMRCETDDAAFGRKRQVSSKRRGVERVRPGGNRHDLACMQKPVTLQL